MVKPPITGLYAKDDYDLAGFAVGAARTRKLLPKVVAVGDMSFGLPSSGVHSGTGFGWSAGIVDGTGLALERGRRLDRANAGGSAADPTKSDVKPLLGAKRATHGHQSAGAHCRRRISREHSACCRKV